MARGNGHPQGKLMFKLDITWHAIDRDLWPLRSWNPSLNETGPLPATPTRAREDRLLVCKQTIPPEERAGAAFLATADTGALTAIGQWDESTAVCRCALVCPDCRYRACNRRLWRKLDDHDTHFCDGCKQQRRR